MKRMAYPASHFMNTSSEFVTIHSLNPNQSTLLTRVDLKETVNIHTCNTPIHMAIRTKYEACRDSVFRIRDSVFQDSGYTIM